jgi:ribokinase
MKKKILVLGNSNVDLIFKIPRFHNPGETILAKAFTTAFGGKGANQAITAKRLGADVLFLTKVGNDHYGDIYRQNLIKNGLDQRLILRDKNLPSGMAVIELTLKGENRIIASLGANASLSENDLKKLNPFWKDIGVFVTQLEIPISTIKTGLTLAKEHGAITLLNPSPPVKLPSHIFALTDFLVPNEVEAQILTGIKWRKEKDIHPIANRLIEMGPKNVIITLGPKGLFFKNQSEEFWMRAYQVKVIDTTGAGDAFLGAFACALSKGRPLREALRFANGAGALATTKLGAQPSLPFKKDLDTFLLKMAY